MTDDARDSEIASVLGSIPVPDYEPGFWDRLDASLAGEPALDRTTVVPMARPRRRSLLVLAAAAVVLAVLAVALRPDGTDDVRTAAEGTTSPSVPSGSTTRVRQPGTSSGAVEVGQAGAVDTPQDAFATWVDAIHVGNTAGALALTGPRTALYEEALGVSAADQVSGWGQAYGAWAEPTGRRIDVVDLGVVGGARVVAIVLQRPSTNADDQRYDALPMVQDGSGWKVEPAAFPTDTDGRIELVAPSPGQQGLEDLPRDQPVKVYSRLTGEYVLSLDLTTGTRIDAADAEPDHTVLWRPPASALTAGPHLLLVAHLSDDTITVQASSVTVSGG